jgi:exopolyphosphatase/guanosine-5'-triphosphate,3'-diphosphate pyrophosphatase
MPHAKAKIMPPSRPTPDQLAALAAGDDWLRPVLGLARACNYEAGHTHQVTYLALRLFDELQSLHGFGTEERFWLQAGCLLHDIGWIEGWKNHHKASLRIIQKTSMLSFTGRERLVIGSITRYHRKALPSLKHDNFAALNPADRQVVVILSSFLRLADGMDRSHQSLIRDLTCRIKEDKITIVCQVQQPPVDEKAAALDRTDLIQKALKKKIEIVWSPV